MVIKKVCTALNNSYINECLKNNYEDLKIEIKDLQYQDAVLELVENIKQDVLILSELLPGEYTKYEFIEKIRILNEDIKIIIIVEEDTKELRKFLKANNIFEVFVNDEITIKELVEAIHRDKNIIIKEGDTKILKQKISDLEILLNKKKEVIKETITKVEKQEIIAVVGLGSVGKSNIVTQISNLLAKDANSKVLLFDLDILYASIDQYFGTCKEPKDMEFIIDIDKRACLNYMVDAINRKKLNLNNFENYIIKDSNYKNLHILTGNKSLYECKEILNTNHYKSILDLAKEKYQYIFLDTSSSIFIDSTQFALMNATKIFFVIEGTYINITRSLERLEIFTNVWNVERSKIKIIVNKYCKDCLEKEIIEELLGGYEILSYIPYDSKYISYLNKSIPMVKKCIKKDKEPYFKIIKEFDFIKKKSLLEYIFPKENKEIITFQNPNLKHEGEDSRV